MGSKAIPYVDIVLVTSIFIIWKLYLDHVRVNKVRESHQTTIDTSSYAVWSEDNHTNTI